MARTNAAVSVTNTATLLIAANQARMHLLLVNNGAQTVYLGDGSVTTANGLPLAAGASLTSEVGGPGNDAGMGQAWYGVVAAGTCDVRVGEG